MGSTWSEWNHRITYFCLRKWPSALLVILEGYKFEEEFVKTKPLAQWKIHRWPRCNMSKNVCRTLCQPLQGFTSIVYFELVHSLSPKISSVLFWYIFSKCLLLWNLYIATRFMMTSSNGNIFRVTGPLCGEFTGPRWIPRAKASDVELWCFLWSAPWNTVE